MAVSVPAVVTDAGVSRSAQLGVELEGHDMREGERVSRVTPTMAPPPTAQHWALQPRHHAKCSEEQYDSDSRGRGWVEEHTVTPSCYVTLRNTSSGVACACSLTSAERWSAVMRWMIGSGVH